MLENHEGIVIHKCIGQTVHCIDANNDVPTGIYANNLITVLSF